MARVRNKDTGPELRVRRFLFAQGLRFRLHVADLVGKPDIVLRGKKIAIFVHGCFWHRHPDCKSSRTPKTRVAFWENKFSGNVKRDVITVKRLREEGWNTITFWECQTRDVIKLQELADTLRAIPTIRRRQIQRSRF